MTRTYEISIEAHNGANTFAATKQMGSMGEAIAFAKAIAADWWRGAQYFVYCVETGEIANDWAN